MRERSGDWIQTYTGRKFWPIDPEPDEVDIEDIAHGLALKCRFNGQCDYFYSVAAHSVNVAEFIANTYNNMDAFYEEYALGFTDEIIEYDDMVAWGLLHDASEAYLPDVPRPIKGYFKDYKEIENRVMKAVAKKFDLPELPEAHRAYLKAVDFLMMMVEHSELGMAKKAPNPWPCPKFLQTKWPTIKLVMNQDWEKDKSEFMFLYETLGLKKVEEANGQENT